MRTTEPMNTRHMAKVRGPISETPILMKRKLAPQMALRSMSNRNRA
jgi:hypothetical protein